MADPVVFPFEANGKDPPRERYGYATDVQKAEAGLEQRRKLRRHPTGSIEFSYFSREPWEFQRLNALLFRKQAQRWSVPLWPYATRLTADVAAGATSLSVVTAYVPWTDPLGLGPYALLWASSRSFELVKLNAVYPTRLELLDAAPTAAAWPMASTWVLPVRVALLEPTVPLQWESSELLTGRIRATFDAVMTDNVVPILSEDMAAVGEEAQDLEG